MKTRTRKRTIPDWKSQSGGKWEFESWRYSPATNPVAVYTAASGVPDYLPGSPRGQQTTVDEIHDWRNRDKESRYPLSDIGGEFFSERSGVYLEKPNHQLITWDYIISNVKYHRIYRGPVHAISPPSISTPNLPLTTLEPYGATAIDRCKPTNGVADAGVALGELFREGLPRLLGVHAWKDRTHAARGASGELLNTEFGWKPLINDVKQFAHAVADAERLLQQYERDAGRVVRRRYEFPVKTTSTRDVLSNAFDGHCWAPDDMLGPLSSIPVAPKLIKTSTTYQRMWFSGAFTYHLPSGWKSRHGLASVAAKAGPLLGLELTPEVLWNLAPWTWAIDWFSNMGDVISNLSDWASDGLVMRYGYLMEYKHSRDTYSLLGPTRFTPKGTFASNVVAFKETKRRIKASPFGFGLSWNSFSPRQLAIAAALGITRAT